MSDQENKLNETWLGHFSKGLELLDDYDHESLDQIGISKQFAVCPTLEEYRNLIVGMTSEFASDVFGKEKNRSFESAVAQTQQGFGGKDLYPGLEDVMNRNQKP